MWHLMEQPLTNPLSSPYKLLANYKLLSRIPKTSRIFSKIFFIPRFDGMPLFSLIFFVSENRGIEQLPLPGRFLFIGI